MEIKIKGTTGSITIKTEEQKTQEAFGNEQVNVNLAANNQSDNEIRECSFQLNQEATLSELLHVLGTNPEILAAAENEAADRADEAHIVHLREVYGDDFEKLADRKDSIRKRKRRPGAAKLRRESVRFARYELGGTGLCEVFTNGYAIYDNGDRRTVIWVPDCVSRTYFFGKLNDNQKDYMKEVDVIGEDVLGDCPWYVAVTLAGEHCIEANMEHTKSDGVASIFDQEEYEVEKSVRWIGGCHYDNPEEAYLRKEAAEERRKVLTQRQREAFEMYYEESRTIEEIAEILNISHQTVSRLLSKARKNIEKIL